MRWIRIEGLRLHSRDEEGRLRSQIVDLLGLRESEVGLVNIIRRSLDARHRRKPVFVYTVDVQVEKNVSPAIKFKKGINVHERPDEPVAPTIIPLRKKIKPIVVGSGPAGLFAALTLVRNNVPVVLLERGRKIPERVQDVEAFWRKGELNLESNVQFGEGGAGTFSDGKLISRTKDPLARWVKQVLVDMGAPEKILVEAKPHIGTDRLREVMINYRMYLEKKGCEFKFEARVTDLICHKGQLRGCVVNDREEIVGDFLILAIGQSAEDTYVLLSRKGVTLAPKPFAMGLRIEHPQAQINAMQYGRWKDEAGLPPAEYFLSARLKDGRSIYTFCMCPGGSVINASNHLGRVVTNGMSLSDRNGFYANSALVIPVKTSDFYRKSPLDGLNFRRIWEEKAFLLAGGNYFAPAEGLNSFLRNKTSPEVGFTTFLPGARAVSLDQVLPSFVVAALKEGLLLLGKKVPPFLSREANLIAVETRTSAPIRILRGEDGVSVSLEGLYPCGEGAGYAGGIISSALDGIKAATKAIVRESSSL
ncbi:MAG: NAD(P)/FAD-dependent oxidoreductase [Syntrophales bacterium]|nr:NAD(P)/FAD-dependent oxidoreductase [Syntrophales bacterium]